jgi:hypothetical protein
MQMHRLMRGIYEVRRCDGLRFSGLVQAFNVEKRGGGYTDTQNGDIIIPFFFKLIKIA